MFESNMPRSPNIYPRTRTDPFNGAAVIDQFFPSSSFSINGLHWQPDANCKYLQRRSVGKVSDDQVHLGLFEYILLRDRTV